MFLMTGLQHYVTWHYGQALTEYLRVYRNFVWFITEFFSLRQLCASLFAPYRRITEPKPRFFNFSAWISALIINGMSRIVGALIRISILGAGCTALTVLTTLSFLLFAFWLITPAITISAVSYALYIGIHLWL